MPSSLIFVGLVVLWLLILVPTVARRQQEVARLSPALLSGRVLERPARHRHPEVLVTQRSGPTTVGELAEARDDVPTPRERVDATDHHAHDDVEDTEIDDEGRVRGPGEAAFGRDDPGARDDGPGPRDRAGTDEGPWPERERDPRSDDRYDTEDGAEDDDGLDDRGADSDGRYDSDGHYADADDAVADGFDEDQEDEDGWSRPPARYRPGRGGFDPEAAAAAAHAKYAFRQRVVLGLLVLLIAAGAAALLVSTVFWWVTGAVGAGLVGYLTYLRRQVRIEEGIRARRAARLAGTRRSPAADDPELDEWADRGRDASGADRPDDEADATADTAGPVDEDDDWTADDGEPTRVRGTGEPLGVLPARGRTVEGPVGTEHESSLPRLAAAPPPPVPAGTSLVDVDAEEEVDEYDTGTPHRRAVGE
ncbi:gephyrin-like molybdotransferase receptor GlpR [Pseudonocardia sp. ICBG1293]|uniref:divisome protein SepX/GlpR n=1 Tax=Pseudonocardia sp. ICBG1293 TaxID=2844382 RepID=UPI0027E05D4F|nr:gephyrin-like molybdotransferase receptor GlpR [Pseudonocardia sp. ICBG1293]